MPRELVSLSWSAPFVVTPPGCASNLPGDKITLPQSALEQLLATAPLQEITPHGLPRTYTSTFDPFNPQTFAAESRAREGLLDRQHTLPHPLIFRVMNPSNNRAIYAGIREFSAEEGQVCLSPCLREALGIEDSLFVSRTSGHRQHAAALAATGVTPALESTSMTQNSDPTVIVEAKQLPKGSYVRLRPLEAGYDPDNWKALLERHLRDNFTTLTSGETLMVPGGRHEAFRFIVDKVEPEGDGICVIDTDLEVDIVALTEEQARETLRRRSDKANHPPRFKESYLIGGIISPGNEVNGQVVPGEYVDYELREWDRENALEISLEGVGNADVYLFASPFSSRQRNLPRVDEHLFSDFSMRSLKHIRIEPTNVELERAEILYISIYAFADSGYHLHSHELPLQYKLRVLSSPSISTTSGDPDNESAAVHNSSDVQCTHCEQWVPQQALILHENYCFRNNILCPNCHNVFQRRSTEWQNHWHCPHDSSHGNDASSKHTHDAIFHAKVSCRACGLAAEGIQQLAQHRITACPEKPILCQFCHLVVPQKGETDPNMYDPNVLLSGLTPHELVDGGRTTECHLCDKIIRLRDMKTHLRHHDLERLSRPTPRICLNRNCGRTVDGRTPQSAVMPNTDALGLCSICFGPLYVDTYDPEKRALRRRIERRYLTQMMTGCGKPWCRNELCKNGRQARQLPAAYDSNPLCAPLSVADVTSMIRPLVNAVSLQNDVPNTGPFYLCADQVGQQRRIQAEVVKAEGTTTDGKDFDLPWCVAAIEATNGDLGKAREWLSNWAPTKQETGASL